MSKLFLLLIFFHSYSWADLVLDLESGNFSGLEKSIQESQKRNDLLQSSALQALGEFYHGDLNGANERLSQLSINQRVDFFWLKSYLGELLPMFSEMERIESEHFILRVQKKEKFLATYALETLEKAYQEIGKELNVFPKEKIFVEIYPTLETFAKASTLSQEILDRSGAIGICKFRRLMILSPEQLAFGYRWLDTLAHEYTHYLVNILSAGKCPLWLHEGIAKYLESTWRTRKTHYLTPGNRTELVGAMKEDRLIPFSRMEPSMVYLENQTQVRQAFSQVAHAVQYIEKLKEGKGIRQILMEISSGKSREEAFRSVLNLSSEEFESEWKKFLKTENLEESPGALPDRLTFGQKIDELEELVSVDVRGHIRLGDRMRQNGQLQAALIQYEKALKRQYNNPVALIRLARTYLAFKQPEKAIPFCEKSISENPNYPSAYLILGEQMIAKGEWEKALDYYLESNAINPFNPENHEKLSKIYESLGHAEKSKEESEIFRFLKERKR